MTAATIIILVGEVKKATFEPGLDPLLYFRGQLSPAAFRLNQCQPGLSTSCVTLAANRLQLRPHGGPGES